MRIHGCARICRTSIVPWCPLTDHESPRYVGVDKKGLMDVEMRADRASQEPTKTGWQHDGSTSLPFESLDEKDFTNK
jgi:hypothetical protein